MSVLKKSVFLSIFCRNSRPWIDYENSKPIINKIKNIDIPLTLMINKWDGTIGFPGGTVDENDTIENNLFRELKEELNFDMRGHSAILLRQYQTEKSHIYFYGLEVDFDLMKKIHITATQSIHYGSEILGVTMLHLFDYGNEKGVISFLKNNLAGTVREDILFLIKKEKFMENNDLLKICKEFNINMESI